MTGIGSRRSNRAASMIRLAWRSVVVHDLDVVSIRVEHERPEVPGVVDRPLARRAVVAVAGVEGGPVEGLDGLVLLGRKGHVQVLRGLAGDDGEGAVRADEGRLLLALVPKRETRLRRDGVVEALRRVDVGDADPDVVDRAST